MSLSRKARKILSRNILPPYLTEDYRRKSLKYAANDPKSYIRLSTAENKLMFNVLGPKLKQCRDITMEELGYDSYQGNSGLRSEIANFLQRHVFKNEVNPDALILSAGAHASVSNLFEAICDPYDGVIIPTPYYQGFIRDLEVRLDAQIIPAHLRSGDGFQLTTEAMDTALEEAKRKDVNVKAVLITSPCNPIGIVYSENTLRSLVTWAKTHNLHIVFNEIYALSEYFGKNFISIREILSKREMLDSNVHIVYALSKDFCMSGLRVGVTYSENAEIIDLLKTTAIWYLVSTDTQYLVRKMLEDEVFVDDYVKSLQSTLRSAFVRVTKELDKADIQYFQSTAGIFIWADFSKYLKYFPGSDEDFTSEHELWEYILNETNVNMTPGGTFAAVEPGWYRICFAALETDKVVEGIGRVNVALARLKDASIKASL